MYICCYCFVVRQFFPFLSYPLSQIGFVCPTPVPGFVELLVYKVPSRPLVIEVNFGFQQKERYLVVALTSAVVLLSSWHCESLEKGRGRE